MTNITHVIKRNKTLVEFNPEKITDAVMKAMKSVPDFEPDVKTAQRIRDRVVKKLKSWNADTPNVDQIHILVENSLMDAKLHDVAREYITYRDANKPDIFRKRVEIDPEEYPHLVEFRDAIHHSFWLRKHFNYDADIQDIKVNMSEEEAEVAIRAMLAISQIENAVKTFWARLELRLPKPEIAKVGAVFADSEVRHEDAYKHLLKKLQLNDRFKGLRDVPCMDKRIRYLEKVNANVRSPDNEEFFEALILFSMFIENVSLFSQFLILMSFRKGPNQLKGISNAVEATSKEEKIHAEFGFELTNIIKEENPDWFDQDLQNHIKAITLEAYEAELEVVDWIYETGELEFMPKNTVVEYIKFRLNNSLIAIGMEVIFDVDQKQIDTLDWFDDELDGSKVVDFFNTRSVQYSVGNKSFSMEELF